MTEVLAIIPARGGSKGIPRKNILDFAGHPLLSYSIMAGLNTKLVNRVIISTDDKEIAEIAHHYGAEVPFLRPAQYAQDDTPDFPVFVHALQWLNRHEGYRPDVIVHLRPTSPLRRVKQIDNAVQLLLDHPEADSVRTVIIPFQNPFKTWTIQADGFMKPLIKTKHKETYNMPRQALPKVYWQTGYVDTIRISTILEKHSMTGNRILPLVLNPGDWIDIDTPDDWQKAENLLLSGKITFSKLGFKLGKKWGERK
jgi:N-acylneuraminate cytidylyltransferase